MLTTNDYQIIHYRPEYKRQVLNVLEHLWSYERSKFDKFFEWRYERNPHTESVLGIIALYRGEVVGFRGYFADRFVIGDFPEKYVILHPGDTVVHPEHRNKGLSVAMGKLAFQYDNRQYPLFMNMTCNRKSFPGYLKMDFRPLEQKVMLKHWSFNPFWMWRYRQYIRRKAHLKKERNLYGRFGDILVSNSAMPVDMAGVVKKQGYPETKLCLYQDESFFKWRYNNYTHNYIFYYFINKGTINGYLVVKVSSINNQQAEIVDYSQSCNDAVKKILKYIIKANHFIELLIYSYGISRELSYVFSELGFAQHWPLRKYIPGKNYQQETLLPLLVRPVTEVVSEQDFIIGGLNTLDFNNWQLKPICADSA